jgi:EpsI family protein
MSTTSTVKSWPRKLLLAVPATLLVTAMWQPIARALDERGGVAQPQLAHIAGTHGWISTSDRLTSWQPHYLRSNTAIEQAFSKNGATVGVYIGYYRNQTQGTELVSSANQFVAANDPVWVQTATGHAAAGANGALPSARFAELHGGGTQLVAWQWYWVDGMLTSSPYVAKAYLAFAKLISGRDDSAVVIVYSLKDPLNDTSKKALDEFVKDMWPSISQILDHTRDG